MPVGAKHLGFSAARWVGVGLVGLACFLISAFSADELRDAPLPTVFWPSAGLALGVLVRTRRSSWPVYATAVAVAVFASHLMTGSRPFIAAVFALGNALECVIAASVFGAGRRPRTDLLGSAGDALRLLLGAVCGVTVTALAVALTAHSHLHAWLPMTRGYAVSHALGLIMLTPVLLMPSRSAVAAELRMRARNLEWLAQLAVSVGIATWVFTNPTVVPIAFTVVFPLLWGAARLGPLRAMLSVMVVSVIVTMGTLDRRGPFMAIADPLHRLWTLQLLLACVCSATLGLVLAAQARERAFSELAAKETALADAQELAQLGSWSGDPSTDGMLWSPQMYAIMGVDPVGGTPPYGMRRDLVHAEDIGPVRSTAQTMLEAGQVAESEYRIVRGDGVVRIVHGLSRTRTETDGTRTQFGILQDVTEARTAAIELAAARDLFAGVLDAATGQSIIGTDLQARITVFNVGAQQMLGYTEAEMLGRYTSVFHDRAEIEAYAAGVGARARMDELAPIIEAQTGPQSREWTYIRRDGHRLRAKVTVTTMRDASGRATGFIAVGTDVTEQHRAESALTDSEQLFRLAFETAPVGMSMIDLSPSARGRLMRVNPAMCEFTGWTAEELLARDLDAISPADDAERTRELIDHLLDGPDESVHTQKRFRRPDGAVVWGQLAMSMVRPSGGQPPYVICLLEDITERKRTEEALVHESRHDPLTGLANRTLLRESIEQGMNQAAQDEGKTGVLYIDLDGFKHVNDTAGHSTGDELLVQVAQRLRHAVRPGDTVARLGGDEFAVVCSEVADLAMLRDIANRILRSVRAPFELTHGIHHITASIGIRLCTAPADPEQVLADADAAMYDAKNAGKDQLGTHDLSHCA